MRKRDAACRLLSAHLAAAFLFLLPIPVRAQTAYRLIGGEEELTTGEYVLVTPEGVAPGALDGSWITAVRPALDGDTVTDAAGGVWTLTVTEAGVTLTDSNGVTVAPAAGGENGITAGEYCWQITWDDGWATFHGTSGEEAVTLAANETVDYCFRAYRDTVLSADTISYPSRFRLYRETASQPEPGPSEPEPVEMPDRETVSPVTVAPLGGEIPAETEITLSCETEDAVIFVSLSTDGETFSAFAPCQEPVCPAAGFGTLYLRAYAAKEGWEDSEMTECVFTEKQAREWNLYFGQLHAHTNLSDGQGSVEEAFAHAAQAENLDFFAVTDHSNSFDNAVDGAIAVDGATISEKWAAGKAAAAAVTDGTFVGIFGYEMTWPEDKQLGHLNTFRTPGWQTRDQSAYASRPTALEAYYQTLASQPDSVSQFNHPGTFYGDFEDFGHYSPAADAVITLLEVAGEDGVTDCAYYNRALDRGWHVAPTNNQTNHNGGWGDASEARTVALAKELTEEALFDALGSRRVYATEDGDLEIFYELNGAVMGSVIPAAGNPVIRVSLNDPTDSAIGEVAVVADGGVVIARQQVETASETLELSVPGGYSYYYLRITQPDGDIAVTAPVWMERYDDMGIDSFASDTSAPVRGEEIGLSMQLFNHEPVDFTLDSLTFYADDTPISTLTDPGTVPAMGTLQKTISYAHPGLGVTRFRVAAAGTVNGARRTYEAALSLSFRVPEIMKRMAVDGSHDNAGVENLSRLTALAAEVGIAVDVFTDSLPENADLLLITAPAEPFSEGFIQRTATFARSGGTVILCGQADLGDWNLHTAFELNRLLAAMGATVRLNDDTAWDEVNNGGTADKLAATVFNRDAELCRKLKLEQVYSQRAGCTLDTGDGTWLVKGLSTTHGRDLDADGVSVGEEAVLLAGETLPEGGRVYVSGGLFLADEVMKAPDNRWDPASANQTILEALLGVERAELPLCTISRMRGGETGEVYRIRGWATSGTSHPGNVFPDTLYLQDDTGGVALMPFTQTGIQVGTPIEVVGQKDVRGGNIVLKIMEYRVPDEPLYRYAPETSPNETAIDYAANGGRLVQIEGKVTDVTLTDDGRGVTRFTLEDGTGAAEVVIEEGIVSGSDGENTLADAVKKGRTVRAIGIVHLDSEGTPVIRVRNCDEVVYIPPRRLPPPATGDNIGFAAAGMMISMTGLVIALRKKKQERNSGRRK